MGSGLIIMYLLKSSTSVSMYLFPVGVTLSGPSVSIAHTSNGLDGSGASFNLIGRGVLPFNIFHRSHVSTNLCMCLDSCGW